MTPEEIIKNQDIIRAALEPRGHIVHWYDLLALMIVGYWLGNWITGFWWWL